MSLDFTAAETALTELAQVAGLSPKPGLDLAQSAALGIIEVVNAHMERALRVISIQRGYDPRDFTLVSFGGAGSLHAADLARGLNIPRVLIPPSAATLSAFGMLAADVIKDYVQTVMQPDGTPYVELDKLIAPLAEQGQADIAAEGVPPQATTLERLLDMRYRGQSYELSVPLTPDFVDQFHTIHAQTYGHSEPNVPVEIVNLRVRAIGSLSRPPLAKAEIEDVVAPTPFDHRAVVLSNGVASVPFYRGELLQPGHVIAGPAIIAQPDTTVFVGAGDELTVDGYRNLIITVK